MTASDGGDMHVLLVNVSLAGDLSGTGHTLKNLFGGLPQSSLMQLSLQLEPPEARTTIDNTVFIDERCILTYLKLRRLAGRAHGIGGRSADDSSAPRMVNAVRQASIGERARSTVSGFLDMSPCRLTPELNERIVRFAPTVIYTAGSSIRVHSVANHLAASLGVPIVLHLMDDWPQTVYRSTVMSRLTRAVLLRHLSRTNALSYKNFAVSEPLCDKYAKKYGKEYLPLMNPAVDIVDSAVLHHREVVEFLYAGSIGLGRHESLVHIARTIAEINRPVKRAHLSIYIPDAQNSGCIRAEFAALGSSVHGYLPAAELHRRYADADVLVHVESFAAEYREFARLSLSTKIPECMGAGKPILAFLPEDLYGSAYIRERECGVVVNDPESLSGEILSLVVGPDLRTQLALRGLEAARIEHSVTAVRERLAKTLIGASEFGAVG